LTAPAFDEPASLRINRVRDQHMRQLVGELLTRGNVRTAADIGCGFGFFAGSLLDLGLEVTAVDGRAENVAEARRRHPSVHFETFNVEDPALSRLGIFDIVICFGLLYHLENPLAAIRNLAALTARALLVESVIAPGATPGAVLYEEEQDIDQGLDYVALIPNETLLIKALYLSGFSHVYRPTVWPAYDDFKATVTRRRRRTLLVAGRSPIDAGRLELMKEPRTRKHLWDRSGRILESPRIRSVIKARLRR
jgi:SAM-dependent methyltransferase